MPGDPQPLGQVLQGRVAALAERPSRHATDPEPAGHARDIDGWREGQWRRAIPRRFHPARLDHVADHAQDTLRMWVDVKHERPNLLIFGPVGTGKTYAAVAALRAIHEHGATVAMWAITTLVDALSPSAPDPHGTMEAAINADVLLLDDLGLERGTDWVQERVYEVVNLRWADQVPTIVTSNVTPDVLSQVLGARVWSRLAHEATALSLSGPDRRTTDA